MDGSLHLLDYQLDSVVDGGGALEAYQSMIHMSDRNACLKKS